VPEMQTISEYVSFREIRGRTLKPPNRVSEAPEIHRFLSAANPSEGEIKDRVSSAETFRYNF